MSKKLGKNVTRFKNALFATQLALAQLCNITVPFCKLGGNVVKFDLLGLL